MEEGCHGGLMAALCFLCFPEMIQFSTVYSRFLLNVLNQYTLFLLVIAAPKWFLSNPTPHSTPFQYGF